MGHLDVVQLNIKPQSLLVALIGQGKGKRLVPFFPTVLARVRAWVNAIVDCIDAISGTTKRIGVVSISKMQDSVMMIENTRRAGGCHYSKLLSDKDLRVLPHSAQTGVVEAPESLYIRYGVTPFLLSGLT